MMDAKINSYSGGANPCGIGGEISVGRLEPDNGYVHCGDYYRSDIVIRALLGDVRLRQYLVDMHFIRIKSDIKPLDPPLS